MLHKTADVDRWLISMKTEGTYYSSGCNEREEGGREGGREEHDWLQNMFYA